MKQVMTQNRAVVQMLSLRYLTVIVIMSIAAFLSFILALTLGSVDTSIAEVLKSLFHDDETFIRRIITEVRLPRVEAGFLVGGMLALAGALMQVLLRNPLAEPYVLGVSGGAAVFTLLAIIYGLSGIWINASAFTGAFVSIMLVFTLSRAGGDWNPMRMLLTGIVIAAGWGAVISFLLAISPASKIHGMLFWLMGDLSFAQHTPANFYILLFAVVSCMLAARSMNLLARGELQAATLGVSVISLRYFIYFIASLLAATAVMQAGSIGFIGLIVPHLLRLIIGSDHRLLIPASVLLGGSLLVVADALARTIIAPQQLPVGVLTAMIGVPLFLFLMHSTAIRQKS